ncbi:alpha-N-arabinofuranosidase [Jonesia quinghaiensis]|uniref:arabinosylfuranosidase ArfA n=1 Tax=Jonesia quinghaiensis TaxID=262806 RepID=UPI00042A62A2|nr:alpha-N-arabinofuranosidase [Jonesia quinghaiensis]
MATARLHLDPAFTVGPVRPRTFGAFVEHLGRCVYEGIFEPEHPEADDDGFRTDVLALTRELGATSVRYPGGNFVSGYRWEDGIGPVEKRPTRLDLAWHSSDPNHVGVDEYMTWCAKAGVEPMMAVNLGTRGVQEALDLLEYCNVPSGTYWSDLRRANGHEEPYRIKMWCLGNEMDGPWQIGHKTEHEYARLATETARAMRMIDPSIELIVCGSSASDMPTFGRWEATVLEEAYDYVDMISAHAYYWEKDGDLNSFLASAVNMDHFIDSVTAAADYVRAVKKSDKRINISFDEWNVWYMDRAESVPPTGDDWPVAPKLLEDHYNVADAVVVGNLLISLLRHTDRVASASLAQLVNVIAPIMTEKGGRAYRQTTFHPFAITAANATGDVLQVGIDAPTMTTTRFGDVKAIDAVATRDTDTGTTNLFVVNRAPEEATELRVDLRALSGFAENNISSVQAVTYHHDDHTWQATADDDTTVVPTANKTARIDGHELVIELPAISWSHIALSH